MEVAGACVAGDWGLTSEVTGRDEVSSLPMLGGEFVGVIPGLSGRRRSGP